MDLKSENEDYKIFENFVNCMEKCIDPDIDPCEDFFGYACGKFKVENYDVSHGEFPPGRSFNLFETLLKDETIDGSLIRKVRDFYNSFPTDIKLLLQDENIVTFCGGFPAFHDNWTSENFDWIKAAAIFSTLTMDTIICIGNMYYLDNKRNINMSRVELDEEDLENAEEILRNFDIEEEKISDIINDVNLMKEKIDLATLQTNNDDELPDVVIKTYEEIKEDEFDYQKFFENVLKQPLNDDDIFHLYENPEHWERFLNVFAEASPKTVANYMTFILLLYNESELEGVNLALVEHYFAPVFFSIGFERYWNEYEQEKFSYLSKRSKGVLERIEEDIGTSFVDVSESSLGNEDVFEYLKIHFNVNKIEEKFADLEISPTNIFENIVNLARHGPSDSVRKYLFREGGVSYYRILFDLDYFMLQHKKPLLNSFSYIWFPFNIENLFFSQQFQEHIEGYQLTEECAKDQIKTFSFSEKISNLELIFWEQASFSIERIKRAYEDYTLWLTENEDKTKMQDEILKRLNLNSRKAFFVSVIQHYCGDPYEDIVLPFIGILNSEEFAKEFECKPSSCMNPQNKCIIKWNKV